MAFYGDRLQKQRRCLCMTQKQLAESLKVSQATICEYETGKSSPSSEILSRLAVALHTSTDYLLGLTDNPYPMAFSSVMSSTEQDLLQAFYALLPEKRERAVGILIGLREG